MCIPCNHGLVVCLLGDASRRTEPERAPAGQGGAEGDLPQTRRHSGQSRSCSRIFFAETSGLATCQ